MFKTLEGVSRACIQSVCIKEFQRVVLKILAIHIRGAGIVHTKLEDKPIYTERNMPDIYIFIYRQITLTSVELAQADTEYIHIKTQTKD